MTLKSDRKADRVIIVQTLTRIDRNSTGKLKFNECLLLLRHLANRRQHLEKAEEQELIKEKRLGKDTVRMFREVFASQAEKGAKQSNARVDAAGIKRLLTVKFRIAQTSRQRMRLDQAIHDVASESRWDQALHDVASSSRCPSPSPEASEAGSHSSQVGRHHKPGLI